MVFPIFPYPTKLVNYTTNKILTKPMRTKVAESKVARAKTSIYFGMFSSVRLVTIKKARGVAAKNIMANPSKKNISKFILFFAAMLSPTAIDSLGKAAGGGPANELLYAAY